MTVTTQMQIKQWRNGREVEVPQELSRVSDWLEDPESLIWVDLVAPGTGVLEELAAEINLDPQAVEDAVTPHERPKATWHATHTFLTVYAADLTEPAHDVHDSRVRTYRLAVFVLRGGLITVRPNADFDMAPVIRNWAENLPLLQYGVGALAHGFLDAIVDQYFDLVQELDDAVEDLEDQLFSNSVTDRQVQQHTYRIRKELVQVRRIILPMREVVNTLVRHHNDAGENELDGYFADLYDHIMRASEWTESLRDMVSTIFETNLSLADTRLNIVTKKLAGWAAVIAVPTAITGWFGQNIPFWGFEHTSGLWLSITMIVVLTGTVYALMKRYDWI